MPTLNAEKINLQTVHALLNLQAQPMAAYSDLLRLESLTEVEQQEVQQIATDFGQYLAAGQVSEGLVKILSTFPILRLAGFYRSPIELKLEERIETIVVEDEDTAITGRIDLLTMNQSATLTGKPFWVLIVEAKNSVIDLFAGLPQLLTYAYTSLENQPTVWGLITNGLNYQFVYLRQGTPATYQLLPLLHLFEVDRAYLLLQALKAICHLQT